MWPITCSTKGWESSLSRLRPRIKRFSKSGWPRQARQSEACWRCCKGISVGLRDSERRRGGQRRIAQESDREVRICQDHPGLPAWYPTSTSENRFQLCRFTSKIDGAGEKVAVLFHIGSWKIAVAEQNANLKAARRAARRGENPNGEAGFWPVYANTRLKR